MVTIQLFFTIKDEELSLFLHKYMQSIFFEAFLSVTARKIFFFKGKERKEKKIFHFVIINYKLLGL